MKTHKEIRRNIKECFHLFARNGVWGTCVDCPTNGDGQIQPELCENFDRYDHRLTLTSLVEQYNFALNETHNPQ
jgi:hypothetical protein